jgi:hypothetical protein
MIVIGDKPLVDINILKKVKSELIHGLIYTFIKNGSPQECYIKWELNKLNDIDNYLMGDMFSYSLYDEYIVKKHTSKFIEIIENQLFGNNVNHVEKNENKIKIKYYLSKSLNNFSYIV